jgi:hypothetical protein
VLLKLYGAEIITWDLQYNCVSFKSLDELPIRPDKRGIMKTASGLEYNEKEAGTGMQAVAG